MIMRNVYFKICLGMIAISLSIIALSELGFVNNANAGVAVHSSNNIKDVEAGMLGEIRLFSGDFAPKGWEFCNGQSLKINKHEDLYSIIGEIYGGDGKKTFRLPDLRGRTAVGVGTGSRLTIVKQGAQRMYAFKDIQPSQPTTASGSMPNKGYKRNPTKENDPKRNILVANPPVQTGDLGLHYIICIDGFIPEMKED